MDWLGQIRRQRVVAVIRSPTMERACAMAHAVAAGGIGLIEITATSDRAWETIARLRQELPHCAIGTGTIISMTDWWNGVSCGAQFMFSPHVDPGLIERCRSIDLPMIPGALSPTEIVQAWQAGAASVKVFPIQALGGAAYLQALGEPLGHIPLIPTGGVTRDNAADLIQAGAIGVGLGGGLFPRPLVESADWAGITTLAQQLRTALDASS